MNNALPLTEELDFSYLLGLLRPLYEVDEFAWLPELFSILGHEKLIELCKYAGGEVITIPTIDQLSHSIDSLQDFYDIYIANRKSIDEIDDCNKDLVLKICNIYHARNS